MSGGSTKQWFDRCQKLEKDKANLLRAIESWKKEEEFWKEREKDLLAENGAFRREIERLHGVVDESIEREGDDDDEPGD